jgi:hypothetical protein
MSLFNQYQTILKEAHLTSFKSLKSTSKLIKEEDFDVSQKLHQLISTKELENIELAWQLAKGQNETAAFEKILYQTFVPNSLQEQFQQDVQPIKDFLSKPLIEILTDEGVMQLYDLGRTLNSEGRDNFYKKRDFFQREIYDKLGADTEYDNILSRIDNDLDGIGIGYQRYVGGSNMMYTHLNDTKKAYNSFKNY